MKTALLSIAGGLLLVGCVWHPPLTPEPVTRDHVTHLVIEVFPPALPLSPLPNEDEPGWDCRTMGNHICGMENSN